MPTLTKAKSKIEELQEQIAILKETVTFELRERRVQLAQELHDVGSELARLTGKAPAPGSRRRQNSGRTVSLQELKELLVRAPEKTISLRKLGIDAKHVKSLAAANGSMLVMGGKGAWPVVTLLK